MNILIVKKILVTIIINYQTKLTTIEVFVNNNTFYQLLPSNLYNYINYNIINF